MSIITATEYEPLPKEEEALMIWEAVFEGTLFKVDRWQRLLISTPEQGEYIKYLINKSVISKVKGLDFLMSPPKNPLKQSSTPPIRYKNIPLTSSPFNATLGTY